MSIKEAHSHHAIFTLQQLFWHEINYFRENFNLIDRRINSNVNDVVILSWFNKNIRIICLAAGVLDETTPAWNKIKQINIRGKLCFFVPKIELATII